MDVEIRHLKLVDAIAKDGSMTKAAESLHLTQSALSHQLREIEDRLGTPLFLRLKRKLILTEAGERLLGTSRTVLEQLRRTEDSIKRMATGQEGMLRISTQCNTCYHWLPSMLKTFSERFPRVEVQINADATCRPVEALLEGKLDIAIVHKPLCNKDLTYHPLFNDELLVVMPPKHKLASRPYIKPEDFAEETLLIYAVAKEETLVFQQVLFPSGIEPGRVVSVMLTEAIIEMVKAGLGVSVMAKWAVSPYLKAGTLRGVRLTRKGFFREWFAAMIKAENRPAYYGEFIKLLAKHTAPVARGSADRSLQIFANVG